MEFYTSDIDATLYLLLWPMTLRRNTCDTTYTVASSPLPTTSGRASRCRREKTLEETYERLWLDGAGGMT